MCDSDHSHVMWNNIFFSKDYVVVSIIDDVINQQKQVGGRLHKLWSVPENILEAD